MSFACSHGRYNLIFPSHFSSISRLISITFFGQPQGRARRVVISSALARRRWEA